MTIIHLTPLLRGATDLVAADATLIARASVPYTVDGAQVIVPEQLRFDYTAGEPSPTVELDEPDGYAWLLQLQIGAWRQTRAVQFIGAELDWADLTDVNPATLTSEGAPTMPSGARLITRTEVEDLLDDLGPDGAPDAAVAARIIDPASLTRAALANTYVAFVTDPATGLTTLYGNGKEL
jgi:hypothetical protein